MMKRAILAAALALLALPALADEQWQTRYVSGGAAAGSVMLGPQKFGEYKGGVLSMTPRYVNSTYSLAGGTSCASTDGGFATDNTASWQPTCFGIFMTPRMDVRTLPTRGTGKLPDGTLDPAYGNWTGMLIQAQSDGNVAKEQTAQFINFEAVGGVESAKGMGSGTNSVGQLISVRQRPGPNGERAPTTWGHNIDFHIAPGAGSTQSWGVEYDLNNFNRDCLPLASCFSSAMFFNSIGGYTNTSWLYSGGGTSQPRTQSVTVSNNIVTRQSGEAFSPAIYRIKINNVYYHVNYVNPDRVDGAVPIPNFSSPVTSTWDNAIVWAGVFFQGENNVSKHDVFLATSAFNGVTVAGNHNAAFNSIEDTGRYSLVMRPGQNLCFNNYAGCIAYDAGQGRLNFGSGFGVTDAGSVTLAQGLLAQVVTTNSFRLAQAFTPPSATAACDTGNFTWDVAYTYVCVATNTWKRSALSSW